MEKIIKKKLVLILLLPLCLKPVNQPDNEWQEITHGEDRLRTAQNADIFTCEYGLEGEETFATIPEGVHAQATLINGDTRCPQSFDIFHNAIPFMICPEITNYKKVESHKNLHGAFIAQLQ